MMLVVDGVYSQVMKALKVLEDGHREWDYDAGGFRVHVAEVDELIKTLRQIKSLLETVM